MLLTTSTFLPISIGFFGLGMGYFVWGGQAFFGKPKSTPEVEKAIGLWGFWMPGFMQFITGVYLLIGLTWFPVFKDAGDAMYPAALAFTAYGVHWFVMGRRRYELWDAGPDGWMAIPFFLISILGLLSYLALGDIPVAILFILLALIYFFEFFARMTTWTSAAKLVAATQLLNGIWLMYLTYATVYNVALGGHWWL